MMDQVSELSGACMKALKLVRAEWESLPIIVTLLTAITVSYTTSPVFIAPTFFIFFFFGRIELMGYVGGISSKIVLSDSLSLFLISFPALIVGIVASRMLHRLSNGKTSSKRVLHVMIAVSIAWVIYNSIFFFGDLSIGILLIGPVPLPFGPLAAVLIRGHIIRLTKEIDELQKSPVPMD